MGLTAEAPDALESVVRDEVRSHFKQHPTTPLTMEDLYLRVKDGVGEHPIARSAFNRVLLALMEEHVAVWDEVFRLIQPADEAVARGTVAMPAPVSPNDGRTPVVDSAATLRAMHDAG